MQDQNNLFPIFLKLESLSTLIVGGGYVANEKLHAVLKNSPAAKIKMVAILFSDEIKQIAFQCSNVTLIEKKYEVEDIDGVDIVIVGVNDLDVAKQVTIDCRRKGKLVNAADKPEWCDFYLSSVVQKGNLKIAISTNGKSPTIAKRLKEVLKDCLPEELDELLLNVQSIRNNLSGDFSEKVKKLNELTKTLVKTGKINPK
jgi:uncharacterized protein